MSFRPIQDKVLVKRIEEEAQTSTGLYIPNAARALPLRGTVLAVGTGKRMPDGRVRPLELAEGDKILFARYAATEIKIDGEVLLVMKEEDVIGMEAKNDR